MEFMAEVLKGVCTESYFKVRFLYENQGVSIKKGFAEINRHGPKPVIAYDAETERKLKSVDKSKLELELLNTVINHIFSNGVAKTWRGRVILSTAW